MYENMQTDKNASKVPSGFKDAGLKDSEIKSELKAAAEKVEAISVKLKAQSSSADWKGLHEIADRIEHFLDGSSFDKSAGSDKPAMPLS